MDLICSRFVELEPLIWTNEIFLKTLQSIQQGGLTFDLKVAYLT
jgi:hypothetical protein